VPSPTFTLVQSYDADVALWHADLYRLTHPDEVMELGLDEALETGVCLIEWPDRLGRYAPPDALRLQFTARGNGRELQIWLGGRQDLRAALSDWAGND
jgi:tRNA threonylcarbamoyladenosine biosynthesis protein TsaE